MIRGLLFTLFMLFVVLPVAGLTLTAFTMATMPAGLRVMCLLLILYLFIRACAHALRGKA